MNVRDRLEKINNKLYEDEKGDAYDFCLRQYGMDRMVLENNFNTIENGIKKILLNMYDNGLLTSKPTTIVAGFENYPNGKEFCVFTRFDNENITRR